MNIENDGFVDDVGCLEVLEMLYAYIDGELDDPDTIAQLEHHMGHCRSCFSRAEFERALVRHVRKKEATRAPDSLKNRMEELIEKF